MGLPLPLRLCPGGRNRRARRRGQRGRRHCGTQCEAHTEEAPGSGSVHGVGALLLDAPYGAYMFGA
ncbi:hypothetical protein SLNWT_1956 [Streptomyces albus]|uniref:Uncharacterized protein n=1 Tax=Streptomyces albus (strain ATCC 21838 / DSM 41398 / FERM P-419 / JCM 4703 / NBRC 107858) TaxID=1081613 RepID=A0A0B5EW75_STRA4|nr:hypothetical protein SLNWT_1956 [Streptomyces albus]AOU76648.1 hypothetical protein SLNHY_1957 [Streptomyces albus]AYN32428.1 hypothetical protein DUI70_1926 [Streptomyces albus]